MIDISGLVLSTTVTAVTVSIIGLPTSPAKSSLFQALLACNGAIQNLKSCTVSFAVDVNQSKRLDFVDISVDESLSVPFSFVETVQQSNFLCFCYDACDRTTFDCVWDMHESVVAIASKQRDVRYAALLEEELSKKKSKKGPSIEIPSVVLPPIYLLACDTASPSTQVKQWEGQEIARVLNVVSLMEMPIMESIDAQRFIDTFKSTINTVVK